MKDIAKRNHSCRYYVDTRLKVAKTQTQENFPEYHRSSEVYKLLTDLIEVNAKGFRGVVVTALTGLYLNENYDPINDFYNCNPRSIFEGGIWYALQENSIPCGKSDPLNVAKNANKLSIEWAKGKRPQSAAMAVVRFLEIIMESGKLNRARLIDYFFFRLCEYAKSITTYEVIQIESSASKQHLGSLLTDFALKYPESGNIPQYLVFQLLACVFDSSTTEVVGGEESVFGTNTTSKKPADIWLKLNGVETNLFEVTVKQVSKKRLDDSLDALKSTGHLDHPVTFICRIPTDITELDVKNGSYSYKGKTFDFVDFKYFCCSLFAILSEKEFKSVFTNVAVFVQDMHISMKTKKGWNEFFSKKS